MRSRCITAIINLTTADAFKQILEKFLSFRDGTLVITGQDASKLDTG
jgi:hypothetical protein